MKNSRVRQSFSGTRKCATHPNSSSETATSAVALVLLFFAVIFSSGCVGLTGVSKAASSQQPAPGAGTISVEPASIRFGSVALGSTASQSVTITNGGGSNLTVTQASTTAAGVKISGISFPLVVAAGKQSTFDVVFSPKTAGALSGAVTVMSDASSSPSTVSLSGTGMAATAFLTASTSSLSFGNVGLGKSKVLSVTLTNAGNSDVTVSKVGVSGAQYSLSGVSAGLILAPGQSATLDVTFAPSAAGAFAGSVAVASNATNSPTIISLSGDTTQTTTHSVALVWSPSTSTVAGYNVYRSEVSGGPYTKLNSSLVIGDTYADSTVQAGLTYYYVVTSVTSGGVESADSAQTSATVPTP